MDWSTEFKRTLRELHTNKKSLDQPFYLRGSKMVDALFQTGNARKARDRVFTESPIEIIDNHWATDPDTIKFKDKFSREATGRFPESVDSEGRPYGNSVRGNFYEMRHVNGFPMKQATWPLVDNTALRESSGLVNKFTAHWHEKVYRSFIRLFFKDLVIQPLKWRSGSSTAVPEFTTSDSRKAVMAKEAMADAQFAGQMMIDGRHDLAFTVHGIGGAYYVVYRSQSTDGVSIDENGHVHLKDRKVADIAYALTSGRMGKQFVSDKSTTGIVDQFGKPIKVAEGFGRERRRTAQAIPGKMGFTLMPIAQAVRKCMYKKAAFSFHHGSRGTMQQSLRDWDYTIAVDVSDHDIKWFAFILDSWKEELLNLGYQDWWVEIFMTSMKLPVYVSSPAEGQGGVLLGDWRQPTLNPGLPSGNPLTDICGAGGMAPTYFIIQVEHTAQEHLDFLKTASQSEVDGFFLRYLRGELHYSCKSKGDDALMLWRSGPGLEKAKQLKQKMLKKEPVSEYMEISYEHGEAFLGSLLLYDNTMELSSVTLTGNILSAGRNLWSPEYGVESQKKDRSTCKRPYPGLAWGSMSEVYGTIPIYGEYLELMEHVYYSVYRESHSAFRSKLFQRDEKRLAQALSSSTVHRELGFSDLSFAEKEVLNDPAKIHYRYTQDDVRPEVLAIITHGLDTQQVEDYVTLVAGSSNIVGSDVLKQQKQQQLRRRG